MKMLRTTACALALSAVTAVPAAAQMCVGFPTVPGQKAAALTFNTLTGGNQYGVEGDLNLSSDLAVFGGVAINDPEIEDVESTTSIGIGGAFFSDRLSGTLGEQLSVCPTASLVFADLDNTDFWSLPVGLGISRTFEIGEPGGAMVHPYAIPAIAFLSGGDDVETDFQISLGATINLLESFYVGARVNRVFVEGADSNFGLSAGLVF